MRGGAHLMPQDADLLRVDLGRVLREDAVVGEASVVLAPHALGLRDHRHVVLRRVPRVVLHLGRDRVGARRLGTGARRQHSGIGEFLMARRLDDDVPRRIHSLFPLGNLPVRRSVGGWRVSPWHPCSSLSLSGFFMADWVNLMPVVAHACTGAITWPERFVRAHRSSRASSPTAVSRGTRLQLLMSSAAELQLDVLKRQTDKFSESSVNVNRNSRWQGHIARRSDA